MPLNRPTLKEIYQRMKADLESRIETSNPSITRVTILKESLLSVLITVFAGAVHLVYGFISFIASMLFPDTSVGRYLERWAYIWGLARKPATYSSGTARFTGTNGIIIPSGTQVETEDGVILATNSQVVIVGGYADVVCTAIEAGASGNTSSVTYSLVSPISGVNSSGSFLYLIQGGSDQETDEELRIRLLEHIQKPPSGGRGSDYVAWAREVPGVFSAWAFDALNGTGTVGVVISGPGNSTVSSSLIQDVKDLIDDGDHRPLGIQVDVYGISPYNYEFVLKVSPNTASAKESIDSNLSSLFADESVPGGKMLISHINSSLITSGIQDYQIVEIREYVGSSPTYTVIPNGDITMASAFDFAKFKGTVITGTP